MLSGPDYSVEVEGDAWDMSNSGDIILTSGITQSSFASGIWDVLTDAAGDPWAHLNVTGGIDSSVYKYATIRMWLDQEAPPGQRFVSVHRWVWWTTIPEEAVTAEDMLIYEGWHTYSYDLSSALIDPVSPPGSSWSGLPKVFRLDIHEEFQSLPFHLDYVKLTGDETVVAGTPFPIQYRVTPVGSPAVTFYYDNDLNPGNGRTLMTQYSVSPPPSPGPFRLYLPLILRNFIDSETGSITEWNWDTGGVAVGTYYVSADVTDGFNVTTWYSEVPVVVTN